MLEYGLEPWNDDPEVRAESDLRYKALTDDEKEFYHKSLPFVLMVVDIGHITAETVEVIIARSKLLNLWKEEQIGRVREIMNKLYGYRANVNNINNGSTWLRSKKRLIQEITLKETKTKKKQVA